MTTYLPRSAWTSVQAPDGLVALNPAEVRGFAVHWPGTTTSAIGPRTPAKIGNLLEGYRRWHTMPVRDGGKGWTDIAYQAAVDQAGRVWDLRGIAYRSAANGDTGPNRAWGALLLLIGAEEEPSPEMIRAVRDWRRDRWLKRYPDATRVVRHADVRPDGTDCPGPDASRLVRDGTFTREDDDDMQLDDKVELGAKEVAALNLTRSPEKHFKVGDKVEVGWLLLWGGARGAQVLTATKAQTATIGALTKTVELLAKGQTLTAEQITAAARAGAEQALAEGVDVDITVGGTTRKG